MWWYYACSSIGLIDEDENIIAQLGAESSALTHGHPLSSLSSAYLAVLIHRLLTSNISPQLVLDTLNFIKSKFSTMDYLSDFTEIIKLATNLSQTTDSDFINFQRLGKGWVAEETLAIALYCSLKYQKIHAVLSKFLLIMMEILIQPVQ